MCTRDVEYFEACVILRLFTGPGVLFLTLSCVFANGWGLKGNPLAEPTNLCLAHPYLLSLLCSFPASCSTKLYLRNSRYLLASWPLTLSVPPAEQLVPYGILLPCNLKIHQSAPMSRACLVCFPSLWFLLTLCFLLSSVLSPSCTFPFSQLCVTEVQLLSLSYRQQRTSYIDLHQAAPFLLT